MPMLFVRYCKNFQSLIFTEAVPYAVIYGEKNKLGCMKPPVHPSTNFCGSDA